jgi:hypothetical protein
MSWSEERSSMPKTETKVRVNVYRVGSAWRYATWVDGIIWRSAPLSIDDYAPDAVALETARALHTEPVTVKRMPDLAPDIGDWRRRTPAIRRL